MSLKHVLKAIALVTILQTAQSWRKFKSLRIKHGLDVTISYYEIPASTNSSLIKDYAKVQPEPGFNFQMDFYCYKEDPRVCFMFDKTGNIAGCQISMLKEDIKNVLPEYYNYSSINNYIQTNFLNTPAYSQRTYFTNPETLTQAGRQNTKEIAEGLWTYLEGELVQIQRKKPNQIKLNDFYRQGCIPGMGMHYFYKINPSTSCDSNFPFFSLYDEESLVGYGMSFVGYGSHGPDRGWYEHPVKEAMLIIVTIFLVQEIGAVVWNTVEMRTKIYNPNAHQKYVRVPTNCYDPEMKKYVKVNPGKNFTYQIDIFCQRNDPRVCIMNDKFGNIAGIILSYLARDFRNVSRRDYDISSVKGFELTNFFGIPAYSVFVYFTNPCTLTESGRQYTNEVAEVLWVKIDGEWVKLDRCQPNGPRMGDFYMQGCYPRLGTIYVYKFNQYASCRDAFLLYVSYDRGSLVEFGLLNVGIGSPGPRTEWYAFPSGKPLEDLFPAAPPCFKNLHKYGYTSLQVYLTDNPDSIKCLRCKA